MITKITENIVAYRDNSTKLTIDQLLSAQDKLTGYLYAFAEEVATVYQEYQDAKLTRKMTIVDYIKDNLSEGHNKTVSETLAEKRAKPLYETENALDANYKRYKMLLDGGYEVAGAMKQRISVLGKERFQINNS